MGLRNKTFCPLFFKIMIIIGLSVALVVGSVQAISVKRVPGSGRVAVARVGVKAHLSNGWFLASGINVSLRGWQESNWINYTVEGAGTQLINVSDFPSMVILQGVNRGVGDGWTYANGAVNVTGATASAALKFGGQSPIGPPFTTITLVSFTVAASGGIILYGYRKLKKGKVTRIP